jgi:hypothetical protein
VQNHEPHLATQRLEPLEMRMAKIEAMSEALMRR